MANNPNNSFSGTTGQLIFKVVFDQETGEPIINLIESDLPNEYRLT